MNSPVIEAVARATGRGADSSVSPGAPRQRRVRHETRRCPSADPAPWLCARRHVLLRDLHLAHHRQRPAGHRRACRSPTWGSPTRRLLEALLPSISTSVLRALQRAQQLPAKLRNRLGSSRFRLPGHLLKSQSQQALHLPKADHTVRLDGSAMSAADEARALFSCVLLASCGVLRSPAQLCLTIRANNKRVNPYLQPLASMVS